ncbi:hypothetical protein [Sedimenticola thiotaurini]|nr:hypothetical protein [Sedimenticola thiotaurini]
MLLGLFLLATASTTALGTTQHYQANPTDSESAAIKMQLQETVAAGSSRVARKPHCTPGFICNAPANRVARVSRHEAFKFVLVMGAGASR